MANTYYVERGAGGDASGSSWTNAFTTFGAAVSAATGNGDVIKVDKDHYEPLSGATTYTFANNVSVICVDKDNSDALATMDRTNAYIGHTTSSYAITLNGAYNVYIYGIAFRQAGTTASSMSVNLVNGGHYVLDSCRVDCGTNNTGSSLIIGISASGPNIAFTKFKNCIFRFIGTGTKIAPRCSEVVFEGCSIDTGGSVPTTFLTLSGSYGSGQSIFDGCDLSFLTGTLIGNRSSPGGVITFSNCKLGSGVTVLGTQTFKNLAGANVYLFNCSSADQHYHLAHYNELGSTVISTSVYVTSDGASYDGTNRHSWVVDGTSYATFNAPYVSPWIDVYHSGTGSITPYMECLRSGSATKYQDDEVWSEWSYQGTSGYPIATIVSECMAPLGTAADLTASSLDKDSWTGEAAEPTPGNAYMKLQPPAAFTPAEIGHIRARICVAGDYTVYVDPLIRGRS